MHSPSATISHGSATPPQAQLNRYVIGCTLVAALGGLLFGFDTAVISGTTDALRAVFGLTDFWLGFTVASALIGTIVGSLVVGRPADTFGRRTVLVVIALLYLVSAMGCAMSGSWHSLLFFRFIGGLGVGGASVVSPMYIAEIAPARLRGRLVAVTQFNIVLGVLAAFFSNYVIASFHLGDAEWRWMLGVMAVPSIIFLALLFFTPQSPRWLVAKRRLEEARKVLADLGNSGEGLDQELRMIQESLDVEHHAVEEPFFQAKYRKPILLAIAIAMFNQLSGINALMYYSVTIFKMAGADASSAWLQPVLLGGVNLIFTMAAMAVIDHFGRKKLMLVGSVGYILSLGATAWAFYTYGAAFTAAQSALNAGQAIPADIAAVAKVGGTYVLASLLVFIASHAFGQGAVIWVFIAEIFPNRVRARGQALGSSTHWIMAALITQTFPLIAAKSGGHVFAFYCAMTVLQLLWVVFVMPETKGVPLEEIQKKLGIA